MTAQMDTQQIVEEISLFLEYAVAETELEKAAELIAGYRDNLLVLRLLKEYYSTLPEAREEAVVKVSELLHKEGVYLFILVCSQHIYLYAVSLDDVLFLSEYREKLAEELLTFFGFKTQEAFLERCPEPEELKPFEVDADVGKKRCTVCGVEQGEMHLLGCIVEVCPWCDGQLCSCNCRFEQLETEEITDEEELERFEELLMAKGRIPFDSSQLPAYPGTSNGLDNS